MNTCTDPTNPECLNYVDLDADPNPRHELQKDYRGIHRSKYSPVPHSTDVSPPPRRNITDVPPPPRREYFDDTLQNEFDVLQSFHTKHAKKFLKSLPDEVLKRVKTGTETVTESIEQHKYARLTDMGYKHAYKQKGDFNKIKKEGAKYIENFEDFEVLEGLSDMTGTVFKNTTTGEIVIAHRGSDTAPLEFFADPVKYIKNSATRAGEHFGKNLFKGRINKEPLKDMLLDVRRIGNLEDWYVNARTVIGKEKTTRQYKESLNLIEKVSDATDVPIEDIVNIGHSKAGGQVRFSTEEIGGVGIIFDAADSPFVDHHKENVPEETRIKSYYTEGSIVSSGQHLKHKHAPAHMEHKKIRPSPGNETSQVKRHTLKDNYYHDNPTINEEGEIEVEKVTAGRSAFGIVSEVGGSALAVAPGVAELGITIKGEKPPKTVHYMNEAIGTGFMARDTPVMEVAEGSASDATYFMERLGITEKLKTPKRKRQEREAREAKAQEEAQEEAFYQQSLSYAEKVSRYEKFRQYKQKLKDVPELPEATPEQIARRQAEVLPDRSEPTPQRTYKGRQAGGMGIGT